jgi:hypothetical protein
MAQELDRQRRDFDDYRARGSAARFVQRHCQGGGWHLVRNG